MCGCSRGKQKDLYIEVATEMYLDAPDNKFNLWSFIRQTIIEPMRGSKLPHVLEIQERLRNGKRQYYANLELDEMALFDDDARLLQDIQEKGARLHCVHVDGGQGLKLRHLHRLLTDMNPEVALDKDDMALKARMEENREKELRDAHEMVIAAVGERTGRRCDCACC